MEEIFQRTKSLLANLYAIFISSLPFFTPSLQAIGYYIAIAKKEITEMQDFAFLAVALLFFALATGYTYGCGKL